MRFFLLILMIPFTLLAQNENQTADSATNRKIWEASLPGGNYMVALGSITAVSNHAYVLDGAMVVTEVNIDTTGCSLVRFYQITPLAVYKEAEITDLLSEGIQEIKSLTAEIGAGEALNLAQKQYPVTTHAKTVEFQIDSLEQLSALYKSISKSWSNDQGRKFSVK